MPKTTEKVKVSVTEEAKGAERLYTITVRADNPQFFLSDAFVARGLVRRLKETLADAAKGATEDYIEAADRYLAGAKPASHEHKEGENKTGAAVA